MDGRTIRGNSSRYKEVVTWGIQRERDRERITSRGEGSVQPERRRKADLLER